MTQSFNELKSKAAKDYSKEIEHHEKWAEMDFEAGATWSRSETLAEVSNTGEYKTIYRSTAAAATFYTEWSNDRENAVAYVERIALTASQAREMVLEEKLKQEQELNTMNFKRFVGSSQRCDRLKSQVSELEEDLSELNGIAEANFKANSRVQTLESQIAELQAEKNEIGLIAGLKDAQIAELRAELDHTKIANSRSVDAAYHALLAISAWMGIPEKKRADYIEEQMSNVRFCADVENQKPLIDQAVQKLQAELELNGKEHIRVVGLYNELKDQNEKLMKVLSLCDLKISPHIAHPQSVWYETHIIQYQRSVLAEIRKERP